MKRNKQLQKTISRLVEVSFKDGKMVESQVTRSIKALKTLPKHQAIAALSAYLNQLKRLQRQHTMYIETVIPLDFSQLRKIKKIVEKKVLITKVVTSINPQILGGFKLRVGDDVWDQTLKGKIMQVKEAILGEKRN